MTRLPQRDEFYKNCDILKDGTTVPRLRMHGAFLTLFPYLMACYKDIRLELYTRYTEILHVF